MDEFASTLSGEVHEVPEHFRSLFNHLDHVRVQPLPSHLPGLGSMAVHFEAGARTLPHVHHHGQHLVFVDGIGVVGDHKAFTSCAGDVISSPPGSWHRHGAVPGRPTIHVTYEQPGDFDRDVDRRYRDQAYPPDLGAWP